MKIRITVFAFAICFLISCGKQEKAQIAENQQQEITENTNQDRVVTKDIEYTLDGKNYKSFLAYDEMISGERPVVYILPEWWGITDYAKSRASQIAELGYMAVVVDMFGDGGFADTPEKAQQQTKPIYENPDFAKKLFEAAIEHSKTLEEADDSKLAAIGYCFGGAMVLNFAREGEPLKGVVSFHGTLSTGVKATSNAVPMLVLNGEADSFISAEDIQSFKDEMNNAGVDFKFINYPDAVHSFTNPEATEVGKKFGMNVAYSKEADEASWNEMKSFMEEIFK